MSERVMKRVEESMVEHSYLLMPRNLNASGHLFGGQLLEWIDETAGIVAPAPCADGSCHGGRG